MYVYRCILHMYKYVYVHTNVGALSDCSHYALRGMMSYVMLLISSQQVDRIGCENTYRV